MRSVIAVIVVIIAIIVPIAKFAQVHFAMSLHSHGFSIKQPWEPIPIPAERYAEKVLDFIIEGNLADEIRRATTYVKSKVNEVPSGETCSKRTPGEVCELMKATKHASIMASGALQMLIIEENAVNTLDAARIKHMLSNFKTLAEFKTAIGPIKINFDLTEQATLTQGRRLNKDAEIQALSLLIYWMESDAVTAAGSDLIFEYIHGGSGSHAATASLRLINEEEKGRKVEGLSGWRRCVFLNDLMTKVVDDKRYPDLKSESEQLIRAMMDDGVMGD